MRRTSDGFRPGLFSHFQKFLFFLVIRFFQPKCIVKDQESGTCQIFGKGEKRLWEQEFC